MHCSPEQVDELLEKLRNLRADSPEVIEDKISGYERAIDDAIELIQEIFGAK